MQIYLTIVVLPELSETNRTICLTSQMRLIHEIIRFRDNVRDAQMFDLDPNEIRALQDQDLGHGDRFID